MRFVGAQRIVVTMKLVESALQEAHALERAGQLRPEHAQAAVLRQRGRTLAGLIVDDDQWGVVQISAVIHIVQQFPYGGL